MFQQPATTKFPNRRRTVPGVWVVAALSFFLSACLYSNQHLFETLPGEKLRFSFDKTLTAEFVEKASARSQDSYEKITSYLGRTPKYPILIRYEKIRRNHYQARAYLERRWWQHRWYHYISVNANHPGVLDDLSIIDHEIVHAVLGRPAEAGSLLLVEGLAVAIQARFRRADDKASVLNYNLHKSAGMLVQRALLPASILELHENPKYFRVHPFSRGQPRQQVLAYLAAGSFVGYLIDQYGISKVVQVYAQGGFQAVFGKKLSELNVDWLSHLEQFGNS